MGKKEVCFRYPKGLDRRLIILYTYDMDGSLPESGSINQKSVKISVSGKKGPETVDPNKVVDKAEQIVLEAERKNAPWWQAAESYLGYLVEMATICAGILDDPHDYPDVVTSPGDIEAEEKTKGLRKFQEEYGAKYPISELSPRDTGAILIWIGIGTTPVVYQEQVDYFRSRGFTCHCVEWPKFDRTSFNFEQHPEYMISKMRELGIPEEEKVTMIGHSRGGLALLSFAGKYPQKLNCAIVSSVPAGFGPDYIPKPLVEFIKMVDSLPRGKIQGLLDKLGPYLGKFEMAAFVARNDLHELFDCYRSHIERSWVPIVQAIPDSLPMAFTFGGEDSIVDIVGNKAVESKKNSIRIVYPDKGHPLPSGEDLFRLLAWGVRR